uniref:Uncharacterized protein n=1 Tax=Nelumbo nucifera TaxID=4432 RepID=A0A822YKB0_NELNU|nr:TPA_asm: hypothetical protein HUJ06_010832 [Nelumbo nucifera]
MTNTKQQTLLLIIQHRIKEKATPLSKPLQKENKSTKKRRRKKKEQ